MNYTNSKDIEKLASDMDFLMSGKIKKVAAHEEAISHLCKAKNLLENAGLTKQAEMIDIIVSKAITGGL
jgi:hypothetical protein